MLRNIDRLLPEWRRAELPASVAVPLLPGGVAADLWPGDEVAFLYAGRACRVRVDRLTRDTLVGWDEDEQAVRQFEIALIGTAAPSAA